jgi:hypothetical protein
VGEVLQVSGLQLSVIVAAGDGGGCLVVVVAASVCADEKKTRQFGGMGIPTDAGTMQFDEAVLPFAIVATGALQAG